MDKAVPGEGLQFNRNIANMELGADMERRILDFSLSYRNGSLGSGFNLCE